jgi:hypothetical protein
LADRLANEVGLAGTLPEFLKADIAEDESRLAVLDSSEAEAIARTTRKEIAECCLAIADHERHVPSAVGPHDARVSATDDAVALAAADAYARLQRFAMRGLPLAPPLKSALPTPAIDEVNPLLDEAMHACDYVRTGELRLDVLPEEKRRRIEELLPRYRRERATLETHIHKRRLISVAAMTPSAPATGGRPRARRGPSRPAPPGSGGTPATAAGADPPPAGGPSRRRLLPEARSRRGPVAEVRP